MQLEAEALAVERGGRHIFNHVGFRLADGEALIVTGPNGAGKSSLLRALAGLLPLAAGAMTVSPRASSQGMSLAANLGEICHYIGHADALKPSLTLAENLAFWTALLGRPGGSGLATRVEAALARLGLAPIADLPCAYLSAGQKRRAALARLVAAERPLWLLDEPLTALDATGQSVLTAMMAEHLAQGGMIVAATHAPLAIAARELRLGPAISGPAAFGPVASGPAA